MMDKKIYNDDFHRNRDELTYYSAKKITEILLNRIKPQSICDVGGGIGTWLRAIRKNMLLKYNENIEVTCFDGAYINKKMLVIDEKEFIEVDLEEKIKMKKRYDLAISLEVAEHLTSSRAEGFVEDLTQLSDTILFSAAIPGQGGDGHINEKFLTEWAEIFARHHYRLIDFIRPQIWCDKKILWWYRQNITLFVREGSQNEKKFEYGDCNQITDLISRDLYDLMVKKNKSYDDFCKSRGYIFYRKILQIIRGRKD